MMQKIQRTFYKSLALNEFLDRPFYAYTLYQAAQQAIALKLDAVSVIEFGVAGGNGMVCLEKHANKLEELLGIKFQLYGFDTAAGLPELQGYKDIMHQWKTGAYQMDLDKLRARLKRSTLIIGDVSKTIGDFYAKYNPAPVGAIFFDVDLYSSTKSALKIFDAPSEKMLPRVRCYFDDIVGNEVSLTNEFVGERLAIDEYNQKSAMRKITPVYHLAAKTFRKKWYMKSYVHHIFDHPLYSQFISRGDLIKGGALR